MSTLTLPAQTLRALTGRYRAGDPLSCEPLNEGLLNRGYRVRTTRGTFFLKHHLDADPADPAPLERRHHATARLEARGLPAVPPLTTPDGRTVAVVGRRCFALHPWVEGRHLGGAELTQAQSRLLGALLGRVHTHLQRVLPAQSCPARALASVDPADTEDVIGALLARVRARPRRDGFDELAEYRLLERRRLIRRHAGARPAAGAASTAGWVHGDFHPLNLLYGGGPAGASGRSSGRSSGRGPDAASPCDAGHEPGADPVRAGGREPTDGARVRQAADEQAADGAQDGEPVAIIDWDRLAVQPRAEEAVRGAAIFFLRPDGSLDLWKVRAYSRAYRRAAGAPAEELAAAVHRVWWERLNDFWMLRWRYELHDSRPDPQFAAASALVVWWTCRYAAVRDAFCD